MAAEDTDVLHPEVIQAIEVANYVVCPEAWRLKYLEHNKRFSPPSPEGKKIREEWISKQDRSAEFRRYAKHAYTLLVLFVFGMFLLETAFEVRARLARLSVPEQLFRIDSTLAVEIVVLVLLLGVLLFTWEHLERRSKLLKKQSGLDEKSEVVAVKGGSVLPSKSLSSAKLGLASTPHALLREHGTTIPVDMHPFGKKVRDRHIAHLLVHLKILAEQEKKQPPHGVLILGERTIKIKFTEEKERWLDTLVDEMRSIRGGVPAVASPAIYKCRSCDVRSLCRFNAARSSEQGAEPSAEEEKSS